MIITLLVINVWTSLNAVWIIWINNELSTFYKLGNITNFSVWLSFLGEESMDRHVVNLVLYDSESNNSVVSYNNIKLINTANRTNPNHVTLSESAYDQEGALWYVVVVIFVYSLSIVFLVISLVKKKGKYRTMDSDLVKFMKGLEDARQEAENQKVLRLRLRWPGNFISARSNCRHGVDIPASNAEGLPEWSCLSGNTGNITIDEDEGESNSSESSYMILPATTVPRDAIVEHAQRSANEPLLETGDVRDHGIIIENVCI